MRVIDVPADSSLPELHNLLQVALGWTDTHLHQFVAGEVSYGVPDEENGDGELEESTVSISALPAHFVYLYDFGDGWTHDVEVLGSGGDLPGCVFGEGRCPPEDCGGPYGYAQVLAALADPAHPEHAQMREWAGDLRDFDQGTTDALVRQTVGQVPASVRLVLDLAEGGVKLTPGGRLPRALVRAVQEQRPHWYPLGRPASIEEDLLPLATLHDLLCKVGLLRLSKGVLSPTRAAADDRHVVRRLRSWLAPQEFTSILADLSVAMLATSGSMPLNDLAAKVHPMIGHGWTAGGRPLAVTDARRTLVGLAAALQGLDLVEIEWPTWHPGPSARTLLPRAIALAHLWSQFAPMDHSS
jgi:hypothetical protein